MTNQRSHQTGSSQDRNQGGSHGGSKQAGSGSDLHNAAEKMRSGNPQERSEAASELGRSGGHQSHKNS